jgi:Ca-activated chloride channel family protein
MDLPASVRVRTRLSKIMCCLALLAGACAEPNAARQSVTASPIDEPTVDDGNEGEHAAMPAPASLAAPALEPEAPALEAPAAASASPSRPRPKDKTRSMAAEPDFDIQGLSLRGVGRGGGGTAYGYGQGRAEKRLAAPAARMEIDLSNEAYAHVAESGFLQVKDSPLSTFSIDVDTASYSNVRRMLRDGQLPPPDAVRIEEMVNYFDYGYAAPAKESAHPVAVHTEVSAAPWAPERRLVRIALRARDVEQLTEAPRNLVFLVDVSGSMTDEDKLPLLKRGLGLLARDLRAQDSLAIVVYAGASGLALPATRGSDRQTIMTALGMLEAGGSTNGGAGIELAYRIAREHFVKGGVNRVILATDGDFNVGTTSQGELTRLIEQKRKTGVFLTVLGFGRGNLKDSTMEALADKGNGNYAYIDSIDEAHKVLVRESGSTLVTVAKDVKAQIEWNPAHVASYRLIGYENRRLADRDFNDDAKDAGEMGAGHTVTALYDVTLTGASAGKREIDPLRYQSVPAPTAAAHSDELLTVKVRYKHPAGARSALLAHTVGAEATPLDRASDDLRFAAAVAGFGMLLRQSEHRGGATIALIRELAESATRGSSARERLELVELIDSAQRLGLGG